MIVYRYDDTMYAENEIIFPRGDSFVILTEAQKLAESEVRAARPDGAEVRGNSLYTWENKGLAERLWPRSRKAYLYELEVKDCDVRHKGDLNFYSETVIAISAGRSPDEAIRNYWTGCSAGFPYTEPRIEVLVSKARVRTLISKTAIHGKLYGGFAQLKIFALGVRRRSISHRSTRCGLPASPPDHDDRKE